MVLRNAPKPAWVRIPGQTTFCCCCTIRTGASVVGWFNFIINSLYVGMLVFALARTRDSLEERYDFLKTVMDTSYDLSQTGSGNSTLPTNPENHSIHTTYNNSIIELKANCQDKDGKPVMDSCVCSLAWFLSVNTTQECIELHIDDPPAQCLCELGNISETILPMLYRSTGIPGIMVVFSILWLTAVESKSMRYIRWIGYSFVASILLQLIVELYFLVYANNVFVEGGIASWNWIVWFIYVVYVLLNLYFAPVLYKYIKLRIREATQGIEQGLLTSERNPPSSRALDVYLEDAFAIDSDVDTDRFRYSIDDVEFDYPDNNVVEYEVNHRNDQEPFPTENYERIDIE